VTQKKLAEARAEGLAAIADDASNAAAWDLLAVTAATLAKNQEVAAARAAVALTVIPERDPAPVQALAAQRWFRLGEALARQKRDAEAVFCYRQAMASDATHFAAGIASALLCQQRKDLAGAVRDADEVLRRDFGNVEALRIRSRCLPAKIAEGR
jgi:tetratricopeptide (TPR) repeat protein